MAPNFAKLSAAALLLLSSCTLSDAGPSPFAAFADAIAAKLHLEGRGPVSDKLALKVRDLEVRDVPVNLPPPWTYKGCYTDSINARTLPSAFFGSPTAMTDQGCLSFCQNAGYVYAGTEYSQECWCANTIAATGVKSAEGDCNMACTGDTTETCGGPNRITVFFSTGGNPPPTGWNALGCFTDNVNARSLAFRTAVAGNAPMTVELCQAACQAAGYNVAGVEYAQECYCDNAFKNQAAAAGSGCNMACQGNAAETCGGPNRLNVYYKGTPPTPPATTTGPTSTPTAPPGSKWNTLGCYTDNVNARTLAFRTGVAGNAAMTIELCQAACQAAGYTLAGVEYAQECYCDNSFKNGGSPAASGCNMACQGNGAETCGGPNRLNVFNFGTTTTTAPPSGPTTIPNGWTNQGCWADNVGARILSFQAPDDQALTIEKCTTLCAGKGYSIAGLQYSIQCFCDTQLRNGAQKANTGDCNMPCSGSGAETCGGPSRDSLWSTQTLQPQGPTNQLSYGSWAYQGCLTANVNPNPLLNGPAFRSDNQASTCLQSCQKFGYMMGGMIAGNQCYCGDAADVQASGAGFNPDSDCNTPCAGNGAFFCGGNNRFSLYKWTNPTPLYVWQRPTGNGAGAFRVLVTGPIVPLIATLGINNKVIFMEKTATSETPGSTGTYELDLQTLQYRTLHVQSDVFCSAGLTLPDKAGRQIVVGGWSGDATYGVRLFTPSGSPGVQGNSDWQENFNEIHLAAGRWYPSAMIMANGSILVVGGENGANGAPTPSLELLPGGGGAHFMDWLQSSDPWNLYPFLVVLPSGGVFVSYYQTGRILDENTFATVRVLPTIPGSIRGDVPGALDASVIGGRTYPLEGTAVVLPQSAPYNTPITVLLCGGSTPFGGPALDNCVSIQPEVPGQDWVIERMPSRRVLSCMAALPDGTYLILNGAHVGTAGFGTSSDPNHNTLLYDPSKPVNQRISILVDATLDRLYHSEAILLYDGTVLVSGSDPEAAPYIQEYRVEIFTPPYLMGNPARPSFNIPSGQTSYGYGATININVNGGASKISLMGAVSSTHGNSMGQRTFFPAFNCNGGACSITTPPNSHVCPPGWFMLFVINGAGVPSNSQWVRIGGDPANLGAWPAGFPDFTPPGSG